MDAGSRQQWDGSPQLSEYARVNAALLLDSDPLEPLCSVCRRAFCQENEINEDFEVSVCRDCKLMVLDSHDANTTRSRARRHRGSRVRYGSSDSMEDLFSHQFSQLINLVRQNQEVQIDADSTIVVHHSSSYSTPQSRSSRWRRVISDNESDGFNLTDSPFGETDSNISFGGYGAYSEHSLDALILDRDTDIFRPLDDESDANSDTDIDPMHAWLERLHSDEEDEQWEATDMEQVQYDNVSTIVNDGSEVHVGIPENQQGDSYTNIEFESHSGDYLDSRGFAELLELLAAEADGSRSGAPPAAASYVESLPVVVISEDHERHGILICAVCKDPLHIGGEAKQLPCKHFYHPCCILPWLSRRNSCPVCRYELPTDDPDYEEGKRAIINRAEFHNNQQEQDITAETSSIISTMDNDGVSGEQQSSVETTNSNVHSLIREAHRRNWLRLAAAPIVSIMGIVLILWIGNPSAATSNGVGPQNQDHQCTHGSESRTAADRHRRWWIPF